ncbi:MAG TPA: tRNA (cytidine(34)-2'-O)-methyltransferase, partial [Acidimicrobiia bacterium]
MFSIVIYHPEIPPNTGNAMRLAAVTGCQLHLIEPLGFDMDDAKLKRAGMDYRDKANVTVHPDVETWRESARPERVFAFTVNGESLYTEVAFAPGDTLLFGPESVGLPDDIQHQSWVTERVRIPMVPDVRSINLSNSIAIVVY